MKVLFFVKGLHFGGVLGPLPRLLKPQMISTTIESHYLELLGTLDKQARLADVQNRLISTNDVHDRNAASNTWHTRLVGLARQISKTGPTNYYARLQALHNPHRQFKYNFNLSSSYIVYTSSLRLYSVPQSQINHFTKQIEITLHLLVTLRRKNKSAYQDFQNKKLI